MATMDRPENGLERWDPAGRRREGTTVVKRNMAKGADQNMVDDVDVQKSGHVVQRNQKATW